MILNPGEPMGSNLSTDFVFSFFLFKYFFLLLVITNTENDTQKTVKLTLKAKKKNAFWVVLGYKQ